MDPDEDRDLLYIAKEGLKAPLPENWKPCKTREGDIYYFNFATNESQWEHPCDEHYKKLFQDAKMKKLRTSKGQTQNQPVSKFKNKIDAAKNAGLTAPIKHDPLPTLKGGKKSEQSFDNSLSVDNQTSFNLGQSQTGSMKTSGGKFYESEKAGKPNLAGSDVVTGEYEKINTEFDDKVIEFQKERQKEFDKIKKQKNEELQDEEARLKFELEQDLDKLRDELSVDMRASKMAFLKEKDKIKSELTRDYDAKIQYEIDKMNKDHEKHKSDLEYTERKTLEEELRVEENRIRAEFGNKKAVIVR